VPPTLTDLPQGLVKKRILDIPRRPPDLAHASQTESEALGSAHPILNQVVTLIDQRCALTIKSLTAAKDAPSASASASASAGRK